MKKETVEKILSETKHGYDMISRKFSQTRKHFWRNLEFIGDYAEDGGNVLDFGCGNGRLLELIKGRNVRYLGVDVSSQLIDDAAEHYAGPNIEFKKISHSQESLTLPSEFFNTVYSIAVFHHLPSKGYRENIAGELFRVTKTGGHIIVTVWNLWPVSLWHIFASASRGVQKKYYKNVWENWKNKIKGKSDLDWNDCRISFTDNEGKKFQRFHRAFTKRELRKLFQHSGFKTEKCYVVDGRNIIYIGKKE